MEKRSHRRIRDLVAHTAFQGLDANEIGCARISIMAGERDAPFKGPNTDERDQSSPNRSHPACNTRPVHTEVPLADICSAANGVLFDHLVGKLLKLCWHIKSKCRGGLEVDHQIEPSGLLDG